MLHEEETRVHLYTCIYLCISNGYYIGKQIGRDNEQQTLYPLSRKIPIFCITLGSWNKHCPLYIPLSFRHSYFNNTWYVVPGNDGWFVS